VEGGGGWRGAKAGIKTRDKSTPSLISQFIISLLVFVSRSCSCELHANFMRTPSHASIKATRYVTNFFLPPDAFQLYE
jgi:hypothetical protein